MNISSLEEDVDARDRSRLLLLAAAASDISASGSDAWEGVWESDSVSESVDERAYRGMMSICSVGQ